MSKINEQKALEVYPEIEGTETYFDRDYICTKPIDLNRQKRIGYINGYDQAMQDFLEKACEWLSKNARNYYSAYATSDKLIEDLKNYMQNESEN